MGTLRNWPRQVNTSPTEVLDIIKANIRTLADALSVQFSTESTVLVFEQSVGETYPWSVVVNGVVHQAVNGVAEVLVERDTEVVYQIMVSGGSDISGTVLASGPNLGIKLPRFTGVSSEYVVTITSTTPGAVVTINGVETTSVTVDAGSTVTWSVSAGDDWVSQEGTISNISQDEVKSVVLESAWSYEVPQVTLTYSGQAPVTGGTLTPTVSYTQQAHNVNTGDSTISSGGTVVYSISEQSAASVDPSGVVTFVSAGSTQETAPAEATVTCSVSLNGKTGSTTAVVSRAANTVQSVSFSASATEDQPIFSGNVSAAGASGSYFVLGTLASGSIVSLQGQVVSSTETWATFADGSYTIASRGTEPGEERSATISTTVSASGSQAEVSGTLSLTQEANTASFSEPTVTLSYASEIPANGGSVDPTLSYTQTATYTSGETSEITSGGEVTYSGTSVDPSSGAVTGADLSTTAKERSVVDTVTASVSLNGQTGTSSAIEVYQAANVATYGESVVISGFAYPSSAIAAAGGSQSPEGGMTYSLSVSYTSGASGSITEGGSVSYTSPIDWGSIDSESGAVTASSRGTEVGDAKTAQVTVTVTIPDVGADGSISGTAEATVSQEANAASYGVPVLVKGSYEEFPAEGATKTPSETTYTQEVTYTSGSTEEVSSGATITYSMDSAEGFTLDSAETGQVTAAAQEPAQPSRSANVTVSVQLNGQSASDTIVATQAAGNPA